MSSRVRQSAAIDSRAGLVPEEEGAESGNSPAGQEALVEWLKTPDAYPEHPAHVQLCETHISRVFLTEAFAYKLKKAVRFDFLDFSTPQLRRQAALEELRLNRRMTQDVYLSVLPITGKAGGAWQIGGHGEAVDWLVQMRRLPAARMLDKLIADGKLQTGDVERLAAYLARYYATAAPLPVDAAAFQAATEAHVRGGLPVLSTPGLAEHQSLLRRILAAQMRLLARRADLFAARVQNGRVIDGHGDLRPEHICLVDPPAVFDCLEFSAGLRCTDVADELSFLAMECDRLGASWVGEAVLDAYQRESGDRPPPLLLAFYKTHRACVRALVAALRSAQMSGESRKAALAEAAADLLLAGSYLQASGARPLLIVMCGLPGSGKTTLARALAERLGLELLRTDELRQQLQGRERQIAGRYQAGARAEVYGELLHQAGQRLERGESLVLDGTFSRAALREAALNVGRDFAADTVLVHCACPRDVALERIAARLQRPGADASEAQPAVYDQLLAEWEWSPGLTHDCRVDTTGALEQQVELCVAAVPE